MDDRMGTIIQLNPPPRAAAPVIAGDVPPHCEIVIFPGVRIERHVPPDIADGPEPAASGTDRGHRPRKSS
jgi:hypothetical protein